MFQRAPSRDSALPSSATDPSAPLPTNVRDAYSRHEVVQSRFFLAELRDAFLLLAFFLSVVRFLEATFFATFFFVRELGFFAPIAVATLSHATPRSRSRSRGRGRNSGGSSGIGKLAS